MSTDYTAYVFYGVQVKVPEKLNNNDGDTPERREEYFEKLVKPYRLKVMEIGYSGSFDDPADTNCFVYCPSSFKTLYVYGDVAFNPAKLDPNEESNLKKLRKEHKIKVHPKWVLGLNLSC